jgi:hypothetical protein
MIKRNIKIIIKKKKMMKITIYFKIILTIFKGNIYYTIDYYRYSEPLSDLNIKNSNFAHFDNHIDTTLGFIKFKKYLHSFSHSLDQPSFEHVPLVFNRNNTYFIINYIADYIALPTLGFVIVAIYGALITIYFKPVLDNTSNLDVNENHSDYSLFILKINVLIDNLISKVCKGYNDKVSDKASAINNNTNDIIVNTTLINTNQAMGDLAGSGGDGGDPPKKN